MLKRTGPFAGAVHSYQTEPAGLPRLGVNSGSPGSGVASSRSSGREPSSPSMTAADAKSSFGDLPATSDRCELPVRTSTDTDAAFAFQELAVK